MKKYYVLDLSAEMVTTHTEYNLEQDLVKLISLESANPDKLLVIDAESLDLKKVEMSIKVVD